MNQQARISDVVLTLQDAPARYLCDQLHYAIHGWEDYRDFPGFRPFADELREKYSMELLAETKLAIGNFAEKVCNAFGLYDRLHQDAFEERGNCSWDLWLTQLRPQFCRDYAAFLKEFGL